MSTFRTVLKNDFARMAQRIGTVITLTIVTLASMLFSLHVSGTQQVMARIAYIPAGGAQAAPASSVELSVTVCEQTPPLSDLVQQRYDAYVSADSNGNVTVQTLRNADFQKMLLALLQNPDADFSAYRQNRGTGVNLIGYMMMFLLMLAFANQFAFANDKEQGQLMRVAVSPASMGAYLAAHCCYSLLLTAPEFLLLAVLKLLGYDIGFTLGQFLWLMLLLDSMGIAFALFINTLIRKPDNASMLGNSVAVLTSVLAGSFYAFSKNNVVLDFIVKILPQKQLLDYAEAVQNGVTTGYSDSLAYVLAFTVVLFALSWVFLQRTVHSKG
ncbi:MAG TPA: ABC transporter permease [Candidatus Limiplasma sp.]|nr:ABC transporter permease [Candidatus Limiplasma sp.]HPR78520.1 ABC transporter permease [Candidatus Limiplasma sp.]